VINCLNAPATILRNTAPKKNFINLSFHGDGLNTFGIGCKAYIFQQGRLQYQQLMLTRGFQSSSEPRMHFGLGADSTIDSLLVVWPNQQYQLIKNIAANRQLQLKQSDASGNFDYHSFFPKKKALFEDISAQVKCNWKHRENEFNDFNIQYLIPHEESTRGPKIAVGDINGDGLDDIYLCGAKGQPGALMVQQKNGSFTPVDTYLFNKDGTCEDVDAVFFDANNDGYPDLYVVSGGNEVPASPADMEDRLYLNNGRGHFSKAVGAIPAISENKSCVAVADVDHDGDLDIFVGNLSSPTAYGLPRTSYLYLNDGHAHFTRAGDNRIPLTNVGMVTAATFADINNDGWPDLIVTGEWMPMKIFINHNGSFSETDIPGSTGLWQTIFATDVNGGGKIDLLAGNWGHNSKLWAGKNGPLKLYVKDFDHNGSTEQVECYTINGKEYTFLAKDELERALPVLKKAYLTYSEVAGKTVDYVFYDLFKDYVALKAETLSSSCFINDGKGNFTRKDLPDELQLAPVMTFAPVGSSGHSTWLAAGNFYGVIPYEGRYDALPPTFFSFNNKDTAFKMTSNLPTVFGEARDAKWINTAGFGKLLVVARNNRELLFLKPEDN
jgi:hypothetical protein